MTSACHIAVLTRLKNATALLLQVSILSKLQEEESKNQKNVSTAAADQSIVVNVEVK
jgi:hypothetical protein